MAARILHDLPDTVIDHGEPLVSMQDLVPARPDRSRRSHRSGRGWFIAAVLAVHLLAVAGILGAPIVQRVIAEPEPMIVSLVDTPAPAPESNDIPSPIAEMSVMLPPPDVTIDADTSAAPVVIAATSTADEPVASSAPPVVESVEYVQAPAPVYPSESKRRRERGTVLLRVLVDAAGRPAQVLVERSSGFPRLDDAARTAVQNAVFRPYEIGGVARAAQVLIPIEFARRAT